MPITRWDPFREVFSLQSRVNSLFREMNETDSPLTTASFVPAVDVYEDNKKVVLKLEVPGIEEKDLDIRVENNTLTVKGERKFEKLKKVKGRTSIASSAAMAASIAPSTLPSHGRHRAHQRQLQERRSGVGAQQEARGTAQADQGQRGRPVQPRRPADQDAGTRAGRRAIRPTEL